MVNERLTTKYRPEMQANPDGTTLRKADLLHAGEGITPRVATPAAMRESQSHLATARIVVGDVNMLHATGIGRIATLPISELRVDAAVRATNVDRLALRVQGHDSRSCYARVPHRRNRLRAGARSFDRREFRLQRSDQSGRRHLRRNEFGTMRHRRRSQLQLSSGLALRADTHSNTGHRHVAFR